MYFGNSEDPDEMQHNAAFHQDLHCLLRLKQPSGTDKHHDLETSTGDPLKYKMDNSILIVSICMGKSTRIQRVKAPQKFQLFSVAYCCESFQDYSLIQDF